MVLLESKQFLTELTRLFPRRRSTGSGGVEGFEPVDNKCRLRATDGKKKISIVVSSKKINKWPTQICSDYCKTHTCFQSLPRGQKHQIVLVL
uniref:Signal recognition particle 14 kDa protein n=1 Tax=Salvator merianae TaxID=96440 RepID=A0A8D0BM57_SALMN